MNRHALIAIKEPLPRWIHSCSWNYIDHINTDSKPDIIGHGTLLSLSVYIDRQPSQ